MLGHSPEPPRKQREGSPRSAAASSRLALVKTELCLHQGKKPQPNPSLLQLFPSKCLEQLQRQAELGLGWRHQSSRLLPSPAGPRVGRGRASPGEPSQVHRTGTHLLALSVTSLRVPASVTPRAAQPDVAGSARVPEPFIYFPFLCGGMPGGGTWGPSQKQQALRPPGG